MTECLCLRRVSVNRLIDASFSIYDGETVALGGTGSSGKDTLLEILQGKVTDYSGTIEAEGKEICLKSLNDVFLNKITIISPQTMLFDNLSVLDNALLVNDIQRQRMNSISSSGAEYIDTINRELGLKAAETMPDELGQLERLKLEVFKAVFSGARLIVFLNLPQLCKVSELGALTEIIRKINGQGIAVIVEYDDCFAYIKEVVDRCIILRSGMVAATIYSTGDEYFDEELIKVAIHGRNSQMNSVPLGSGERHELREYRIYCPASRRRLSAKPGTVVGIYDEGEHLSCNKSQFVSYSSRNYEFFCNGKRIAAHSLPDYIKNSMAVLAEDSSRMVFENMSLVDNVCLLSQKRLRGGNIIERRLYNYIFKDLLERYDFLSFCRKNRDLKSCYGLSYEQQLEIMISRWLCINPNIVFFLGTLGRKDSALQLSELPRLLAEEGKAVVIVSSNYNQLQQCNSVYSEQLNEIRYL